MVRKLLPILGVTFIDIVGFSMLIPMLPYFVTHFGVSPFVVGVLFSTFSLCQFVSAPLWGAVSDRLGRKMVLIISQIGATFGWAMLGFAPNIATALAVAPIPVVFVARVVEGVSGGNIGITQAYVADLVEPRERSRAFGLIGAMFAAGMVFGPAGGGLLYARYGFAVPFLVAAALQFVTLIITIVMLPESRARVTTRIASLSRALGKLRETATRPRTLAEARDLAGALRLVRGLRALLATAARILAGQTDYLFSIFAVFNVFMNAVLVGRVSARLGDRAMSNVGLCFARRRFCDGAVRAQHLHPMADAAFRIRLRLDEHGHNRAHQQRRLGS